MTQKAPSGLTAFIDERRKMRAIHKNGVRMFQDGSLSLIKGTPNGPPVDISQDHIRHLDSASDVRVQHRDRSDD
jgi:hypothetical protein